MPPSRNFRRLLRLGSLLRRDAAHDMDEEIDTHLALRVEDLRRRGLSEADAQTEARRRFGESLTEERLRLASSAAHRDARLRRRDLLGGLRQDVRFALRQMRRAPAFTALAVLTMALAVGATTAIFTVVDHVVFRPLPFPEPERLVALSGRSETGEPVAYVSSADWLDWRAASRTLAATALYRNHETPYPVGDGTTVERVAMRDVSADFFTVLGAPMLVGRAFTAAEVEANAPVAVVSEGYWRRALGADPSLREPLRIAGRAHTVVGVVADEQVFPEGTDLWLGTVPRPGSGAARTWVNWMVIARLAPGRTIAQAREELDAVAARVHARDPAAIYSYGADVRPLRAALLDDAPRQLEILLGAVALVLLIACANLAGANLARGVARAPELAVRVALGAGRARLVRQLLVEQLLLAGVGGAAGVLLARWLVRVLVAAAAGRVPRIETAAIDLRVLAAAAGITLLAVLASGLLPALRLSRASVRARMGGGGRGSVSGRGTPGLLLVGGELALALVLLAGAGLLVRSLRALLERDLGFRTAGVTAIELDLAGSSFTTDTLRHTAFWDALLPALRAVPGVTAAGAANAIPLGTAGTGFIDVDDRIDQGYGAGYRVVSDDYFRTLGIPLLAGRTVDGRDRGGAPVVVVNQAMARAYWPGQSPIGHRVRARSMEGGGGAHVERAPWRTVVGVVGDIRHWGYDEAPRAEMYVPYTQSAARAIQVTAVVRSAVPLSALAPAIRARVRAIDPDVAVELSALQDQLDRSLAGRRLPLLVLSGFSVLALVLAAVGLYSVLAFTVARRTRELAVRAALGAARARLLRLVLGQALRVLLAATAAGLAGAWAVTRLLRAMLVDVSPTDPLALG
ncbi:MAG TPA: ADOP family duplicated permease, partial [Gemmatimonadaceae bacterium]|nr:ADOP family duplicated permease [Gemmatimonadaceae bacterium]